MFRRLLPRRILLEAGEKARMTHSLWLTHHLVGRNGIGSGQPGRVVPGIPEIPSRKVSDGGFARIMATPLGRAWAEDWWNGAMDCIEDVDS
jgi:hypothetical protein